MPLTIDTDTRNAKVDAATAKLDVGTGNPAGALRLLDGASLLVEIPLNNPAFGAAAGGVAQLDVTPNPSAAAIAAGDADNCEFVDRDGAVKWTGDVAGTGSGAVVELNNTNIAVSQTVTITGGTYTQPASP